MEVTGIYATEAEEIRNASIVGGSIVNGNLVLVNGAGDEINAGQVNAAEAAWPIGSIYISMASANPATTLGFGVWGRIAAGRMIIGVDGTDPTIDAAGEIGGEKTHVLTIAEMPTHDHGGATGWESDTHTHAGTTEWAGEHFHLYNRPANTKNVQTWTSGVAVTVSDSNLGQAYQTTDAGEHQHTFTTGIPGGSNGGHHSHEIGDQGGGAAHNNLPPFFSAYIWQRTS